MTTVVPETPSLSDIPHPTVEESAALAGALHAAQTDKAGLPYIGHLARVARHLRRRFPDATIAECHAAWLHDILEDTPMTRDRLAELGYEPTVIAIIAALTKPVNTLSYQNWIEDIVAGGDISSMRVKLADLSDNADLARLAALPEERAAALRAKYELAIKTIEAALARPRVRER